MALTDQAAVLEAIQARLISQITSLNESTCFLTLEPVPPKLGSAGNLFVTICPDNGQYNPGVFEGAGNAFLEENGGVIVSVFSRMRLDRNDRAASVLTEASRGLLKVWKPAVLKALTEYTPENTDEEPILANPIQPRGFSKPNLADDEGLIGFSLHFDTDFDWDLS